MIEVELTEAGKRRIQEHHPQGIVWGYDLDKPFPHTADGKPTIKKVAP